MMRVFLGVLAVLVLCAQPAFAAFGISSVAGAATEVSAPSSAVKNAYTSASEIRVWFEGASETGGSLITDHNGKDGTYVNPTVPGSVSGLLRSYMVHFDPNGLADVHLVGSITFENPILGLFLTIPRLVASDVLRGGTTYEGGHNRGLELAEPAGSQYNDIFTISTDRKTLTVNLQTGTTSFDEVRVVTAVPEMATIGSWGLLGLGFVVALRRKWIAK
jgi:hypothetical protein